MAVREAVLSQSPEFKNARVHAYDNATAVYDLLCISLARRKQHQILIEVSCDGSFRNELLDRPYLDFILFLSYYYSY